MMDALFFGGSRQSSLVREIPVRFVSSEPYGDRSSSAVKIQRFFRGFLVRKSVKKIMEIRRQVEEIEKRVSGEELVSLIRGDSKERLRVNEILMSFLFQLDSVRGIDSGVRECRKAVTKKAIALQEFIDDIVIANADVADRNDFVKDVEATVMEDLEEHGENHDINTEAIDSLEESRTESQSDSSASPQSMIEACEVDSSSKKENVIGETDEAGVREEKEEKYARNSELLEKMMEENGKMMDMMVQLFERNEKQTKMLSSLSHRVGQLEKAYVCDKWRRMKKKRNAGAVDSYEKTPDNNKKGGKR